MGRDLLGERAVGDDRDHAISPIHDRVSASPILSLAGWIIVMGTVNKDANSWDRPPRSIVEIGLAKDVCRRRVLGQIRKSELAFVKMIEERALERRRWVRAIS